MLFRPFVECKVQLQSGKSVQTALTAGGRVGETRAKQAGNPRCREVIIETDHLARTTLIRMPEDGF
jgi:hypothetical protein